MTMTSAHPDAPPILAALELLSDYHETQAGQCMACCPAHDDERASLAIGVGRKGGLLLHCFAGCELDDILGQLGMERRDLYPGGVFPGEERFVVRDHNGVARATHRRILMDDGKDCPWTVTGVKTAELPLYGAETVKETPAGALVYVVEGEVDCDALRDHDAYAFGTVTGATGTPCDDSLRDLRKFNVALWPDNDDAGRDHMARIGARLAALGITVVGTVEPPDMPNKGGAVDFFAFGGTVEALPSYTRAVREESQESKQEEKTSAKADKTPWTEILADEIMARHFFAKDAGRALWVYAGGVYVERGADVVRREVKRILTREKKAHGVWTMRRTSEVVEFITVDAPELLDAPPPDVINVANGLLTLATRDLQPHSPEFLSPVQFPMDYDKAATCPAIDAFVGQVFPADALALAYQLAGWLLTPDIRIQKIVLLTGEGGTGKSTYLTLLVAFMGRRNVSAIPLQRLESDKFAAARLVGKLANIFADLPSEALKGTSMLKAITGGDAIPAERKFLPSFDLYPYARLIFSANEPPKSPDASEAFYDRWHVVPLSRRFRGTDDEIDRRTLDARLAAEMSGLLNRALDAWDGLQASPHLLETESTRRAAEAFREVTDPFSIWLNRYTIDDGEAFISRGALCRAYNDHLNSLDRANVNGRAFGHMLKRARPDLEEGQRTVDGQRGVWCYLGIRLVTDEDRRPKQGALDW
jgi:putative DNA primase/helicase